MPLVDYNRDIRNSIYAKLRDLLTNPPASLGMSPYTVYDEAQLRLVQAGKLSVVRPSVFLVSSPYAPVEVSLPMVAIETVVEADQFELGNINGSRFQVWLHCFGRQKNEASLLASLFQRHFRPLPIYDYADPNAPTLREIAGVRSPIRTMNGESRLSEEQRRLGAFDHWLIVHATGWTRN